MVCVDLSTAGCSHPFSSLARQDAGSRPWPGPHRHKPETAVHHVPPRSASSLPVVASAEPFRPTPLFVASGGGRRNCVRAKRTRKKRTTNKLAALHVRCNRQCSAGEYQEPARPAEIAQPAKPPQANSHPAARGIGSGGRPCRLPHKSPLPVRIVLDGFENGGVLVSSVSRCRQPLFQGRHSGACLLNCRGLHLKTEDSSSVCFAANTKLTRCLFSADNGFLS
jgi:hypothetical protein